ncbi:MAG: putative ABC transporter permease [bacterium]|nr:putative ABC transporter permease [bacterium]
MAKKKRQKSKTGTLDFYKIFWIFIFGGFFGYFYEGLLNFYFFRTWQGNDGVIYGTFNQVYGFGAAAMIIILYQLKNQPWWLIFLVSCLLGGAIEYAASFLQQEIFGFVSWDYNQKFLNLGGRTTIPYMLVWGMGGTLLIKIIYPWFQKIWHRFPPEKIKITTFIVLIFLIFNFSISSLAVWRMGQRRQIKPARNHFEHFLDQRYPDSRLKKVYPYMKQASN